jgi:cell wall assembly regulator SMI1
MYKYKLIDGGRPLTIGEIENVEKQIGLKFPESLQTFYLLFNGGKVEKSRRIFVDREGDIEAEVKTFLPIKYKRFEGDSLVEESYELFVNRKRLIPPQFIPFAMDSGGFRYCVDSESEAVFFNNLDHIEEPGGAMEFIAPSIEVFVNGMLTEKQAYS